MRCMRGHIRAMAGGFALLLTLLSLFSMANPLAWGSLGSKHAPAVPTPILQIPSCDSPQFSTKSATPLPAQVFIPAISTEKLLDSVVIIQNGATLGSGVIISTRGYILTAAHLLANTDRPTIYLNDREAETGHVIHRDPVQDIALIKVATDTPNCLKLRTQWLSPGSPIYGVGFATEQGGHFTFNQGIVLGYRQSGINAPVYLETGMNLLPGTSGGPLLDTHGQVVGIISWKSIRPPQTVRSYATVTSFIRAGTKLSLK